jgi:hypothetical protein
MPVTPIYSLVYPDSGGSTRLWEHFQNLAESVETALGTVPTIRHIGTSKVTSSSADVSAETVVDTITVDVVSGEDYSVDYHGVITGSAANNVAGVALRETSVAGTQMASADVAIPIGSSRVYMGNLYAEYQSGATGTKTFVVTLALRTGTGTVKRYGSSAAPAYLVVNQIS